MKPIKLIFLDIDGVLNTSDYQACLHILCRSKHPQEEINKGKLMPYYTRDHYGQLFNPMCVKFLEALLRNTGAKIVISSTWRMEGLSKMRDMWKGRHYFGEIIGITPVSKGRVRGLEIAEFLGNFEGDVESYVIIDDDSADIHQKERLCKCNNRTGFGYKEYWEALKILES